LLYDQIKLRRILIDFKNINSFLSNKLLKIILKNYSAIIHVKNYANLIVSKESKIKMIAI